MVENGDFMSFSSYSQLPECPRSASDGSDVPWISNVMLTCTRSAPRAQVEPGDHPTGREWLVGSRPRAENRGSMGRTQPPRESHRVGRCIWLEKARTHLFYIVLLTFASYFDIFWIYFMMFWINYHLFLLVFEGFSWLFASERCAWIPPSP